jgi:hypothetical protein
LTQDLHLLRERVIALLPTGRHSAVSAKQLASELGTTTRLIGECIESAILVDQYPIGSLCGANHGYFLMRPDDPADLEAGVGHSVRRAAAIFKRIRAVRRNYEAMEGAAQSDIWDVLDEATA